MNRMKQHTPITYTIHEEHARFINWIPPFIDVLKEKGGSATAKEVNNGIADKMKLSEKILSERHEKSGQLKFSNQVYWAKQYLAWEKLVTVSKRGVWALTETGIKATLTYNDAFAIVSKWIKINQENSKNKNPQTPNTEAEQDIEEQDADIKSENSLSLIEILKKITPTNFEHLCSRLLREYDFENITVTPRSHDGGIDGKAVLKLNPFMNMSVYFQCKKYSGTVPISDIREFIGILESEQHGVDRGLFITTGTFTATGKNLGKNNTKLELIDGDQLVEMFEKAELGVTPRTVYDPDLTFFQQYMN